MILIIKHCVNDKTIMTAKRLVFANGLWRKRGGLSR